MKFLIAGHSGSYNRGCEAIVRATIMMLQKEFNNPEIVISAFDYKKERNVKYGKNIKVISAYSHQQWEKFSRDWFKRQLFRVFGKDKSLELEYSPLLPYIKKTDVVLSVGGDNYTSDYTTLPYFLKLNILVKEYNKKLVIWGASIGPFTKNKDQNRIIETIKLADLLTIREKKSLDYLHDLGFNHKIKLVSDPAFILPAEEINIEEFHGKKASAVLGYNISPILERYSEKLNNEFILGESANFISLVQKQLGLDVVLIPHVIRQNNYNNDYEFMSKLYDKFKTTGMVKIVGPNYTAAQLKYIISKCRLFIGARTHSTIAALSSGVPTLSIGYSTKAEGINTDLFGHQAFLLNIKEFSSQSLFNKFKIIYDNESEIRKILKEKIPQVKENSWANIKYLKELLINQ